ncbi:MAG: LPS assembly lipoprotein LptE [Verrucomicrobiota bacterium]|jgi:outer membrane lipopolysaccharide assembly protein LptE/RlpB
MRRLLAAVLAAALAGCAGYHLGPSSGLPAGSLSVQVLPFVNHTREPRISEYLSASMRRQFQQDGTFHLQTAGTPDMVVSGEIIRFERSELSYATNDVLTPQEYTLVLTANVVARDPVSGKTNLNRAVQGRTYIRAGNDLASTEREAMPNLAEDLARNAVSILADGPW